MSRCKHTGPRGQCTHQAVDSSDYCITHSSEAKRKRQYQFSDPAIRERFEAHSESDLIDTVRQEVSFLRSLIEERRNLAKTDAEKISAFAVLHPAISNLNKLVESLCKLERQTSAVVGKAALGRLGEDIVHILVAQLKDVPNRHEIIDVVADEIANAIGNARNEPGEV